MPSKDDWINCFIHLAMAEYVLKNFPYSKSGPHDTERQHQIVRHLLVDIEITKKLLGDYIEEHFK